MRERQRRLLAWRPRVAEFEPVTLDGVPYQAPRRLLRAHVPRLSPPER
ncbi:hypothetical protein QNO07_23590 [Streptomyces sp. 549]|nr:hypothetical protein [Streptomyces sp. 549]MDK1476361.1 hypothetical protein [Streptomyces sp. 549]